jgi:hypothetical protein
MSDGISSTPNKTSRIPQRTGSLREKYGQSGLDYTTNPLATLRAWHTLRESFSHQIQI